MLMPMSRRTFVKHAALAGAAGPLFAATRSRAQSPSETLSIAFIGVGGIGGWHTSHAQAVGAHCPCYCDVDTSRMGNAASRWPKAKAYTDYREMFDRHHREIDAVMIGIPDHSHYPATMMALQLGKHVYTQKPLVHTVWEARQLARAAKKYRLATQMGNQGHAGEGIRVIYECIRSGMLGDVTEVHTWTNRPIWPQGIDRPDGADPVPESLDWDAWIGPAPMRPYKKNVYHAFKWRGWLDFGTGALGDMACHTMDSMFLALQPGHPTAVEPVAATRLNDETYPNAAVVKWEFPAGERSPAFDAYWYDGNLRPPRPKLLPHDEPMPNTGNLFIGTKATLIVSGDYGNRPRAWRNDGREIVEAAPKLLERSPGHMEEWAMACRGEKPWNWPGSNFTYAAPMTETILLGNVALRAGRRLEWDGKNLRVTNVPEANEWISKEYREGWNFTA
ncbi:MAG: Gfo/Idh/MocA family oxidoreductase [Planctomycetota bacterium]|nr:Gfo/Idh/MocA family oxidoreductase [Planctomycetota bacterium]